MPDFKTDVQALMTAILGDPSLCYRDKRICFASAPPVSRETIAEALRERDRVMPVALGTPVAS